MGAIFSDAGSMNHSHLFDHFLQRPTVGLDQRFDGRDLLAESTVGGHVRRGGRQRCRRGVHRRCGQRGRTGRPDGLVERGVAGADVVLAGAVARVEQQCVLVLATLQRIRRPDEVLFDANDLHEREREREKKTEMGDVR